MRKILLFLIVCAIVSVAVSAADYSNSTTNKEWLQYGRTYSNARYYPSAINLNSFGQLWNKTANNFTSAYVSAPVAKDGVVYLPGIYGTVFRTSVMFALDATNGNTIWNTTIPAFNSVIQNSAVAGGRLFATGSTNSADVFALNISDGAIIWNATALLSGGAYPTSPLVYDDRLYVLGYHSAVNAHPLLYVYNVSSGVQLKNRTVFANLNYRGARTMAVYRDSYLLVAAGHGTCPTGVGKVFAYNISNVSQQIWTQDVGCGRINGLALSGDYLFVPADGNQTLWALNASDGSHLWNYTASDDLRTSPAVLNTAATDYVYIGSHDNVMHAINVSTGAAVWTKPLAINSETAPLVSDSVLFGSSGTNLRAFNPLTGASLWNGTINAPSASAPIFVNDPLFIVSSTVGGNPGYIYSFGQVPGCGVINKSITLTRNLTANGTCFTINTSNVVVDCAGHTIFGNFSPLSKGAHLLKNNITLRNCNFRNFLWGIYLDGSNDSTIIDNSANNNTFTGLILQFAHRAEVSGNTFDDNNVGIYLFTSNFSSFENDSLYGNAIGVQLVSAAGFNNFTGTRIKDSANDGIEILDGTSANNRFLSINISNSSNFDLDLATPSPTNSFIDILVGPISTEFSFDMFNGTTQVKGVQTVAPFAGKVAVGKYVNVTKAAGQWMVLNMSYTNADVANIVENTIRMYRYVGGAWQLVPNSTVFVNANLVSANITNFSNFGLFGNRRSTRRTTGGGGSSATYYNAQPVQVQEEQPPQVAPKVPSGYNEPVESAVKQKAVESVVDSYVPRDDMMMLRSDSDRGHVKSGMSASSIVGLALLFVLLAGLVAYLMLDQKTKDKWSEKLGFKK